MPDSPRGEPPGPTVLFVYGTLKRGLRNHRLIADQQFLGDAVTEPRYRVIDLGEHPGLVIDSVNGLAVRGELWAVNDCCLAELDEFEEVPGPFIRETVAIEGREEEIFAYVWNRPVPEGAASGGEWPRAGGPET
jgi:gamma-glutamylaminecyclotransferase